MLKRHINSLHNPLRILFIIDELDVGGTEQQILELVKGIDRGKYYPLVCCFRKGAIAEEIERMGTRVIHLKKHRKIDPILIKKLVYVMKEEEIDIVQTYLFTANTWGRLAAKRAKVPVIIASERNVDMWEESYKPLIGKFLAVFTDRIVVNAAAVKTYLVQKKRMNPSKIVVIHNGVNMARFLDFPPRNNKKELLGIPSHSPVIGIIARLEEQKDHPTFLRAAHIISQADPNARFLVVGDGLKRKYLEEQVRQLDLRDQVIFTGSSRDIPGMLNIFDVSVISSRKEGLSNTILESMAMAKPVVATAVGGNLEVVQDGQTGILVPAKDPYAMAQAILRLLKNREFAAQMGEQGKKRVKDHFSVGRMIGATQQLYDSLVAAGPAMDQEKLRCAGSRLTLASQNRNEDRFWNR